MARSNLVSVAPSFSTQWHIAGAGDFMETDKADLIWENTLNGQRLIWVLNNGQPTSTIALGTVAPTWHIIDH